MRKRAVSAAALLCWAAAGHGQVSGAPAAESAIANGIPAASLRFEVASVKPVSGGRGGGRSGPSPGAERYLATNTTLRSLITQAYRVRFDMVVGGPDWIRRDLYDVRAKAERPSTGEELRIMLQNLLADRFQLRLHRDVWKLPVYELAVDKNGPKLKRSDLQAAGNPSIDQPLEDSHRVRMKATSVSMKYLAWRLQGFVDEPVIDKTGLAGDFDFDLAFVEDVPQAVAERALASGRPLDLHPSIFEALRQQLGLRLESGKGPVEFTVIDRVERPSAN
jgi:uncharacterized protein (TIGR03435 family)